MKCCPFAFFLQVFWELPTFDKARRAYCVARSKQSNTCHPWQSLNSDFCEGASNVRIWIQNSNGLLNEKGFDSIQSLQDLGREKTCFSSSLRKRARNKTSKELGREKTPSLLVTAFFFLGSELHLISAQGDLLFPPPPPSLEDPILCDRKRRRGER